MSTATEMAMDLECRGWTNETTPRKKRVYISGQITGMPNGNKEAFAEKERELIARGYEVYNPQRRNRKVVGRLFPTLMEAHPPTDAQWMAASLYMLAKCDIITFLPGVLQSPGGRIEMAVSYRDNMPGLDYDPRNRENQDDLF
jgi:hypothetical protein